MKREIIVVRGFWFTLGFMIIIIGILMNNFVIAQNGGRMPVKDFTGENKYVIFSLHQSLDSDTKYPYLSDIIWTFSIGDIIMFLGIIPMIKGIIEFNKQKAEDLK